MLSEKQLWSLWVWTFEQGMTKWRPTMSINWRLAINLGYQSQYHDFVGRDWDKLRKIGINCIYYVFHITNFTMTTNNVTNDKELGTKVGICYGLRDVVLVRPRWNISTTLWVLIRICATSQVGPAGLSVGLLQIGLGLERFLGGPKLDQGGLNKIW